MKPLFLNRGRAVWFMRRLQILTVTPSSSASPPQSAKKYKENLNSDLNKYQSILMGSMIWKNKPSATASIWAVAETTGWRLLRWTVFRSKCGHDGMTDRDRLSPGVRARKKQETMISCSVATPVGDGYFVWGMVRGGQHFLLSPLDCLSAKAGGAAGGSAYALFNLTAHWLGWLCDFPDK